MKHRIFILALIALSLCTTSCTKRALWEANELYDQREPSFPRAEYGKVMLVGSLAFDSRGNIVFKELVSDEKLVLIGDEYPMDHIRYSYEVYLHIKDVNSCCYTMYIWGNYCPDYFLHLAQGLRRFRVYDAVSMW